MKDVRQYSQRSARGSYAVQGDRNVLGTTCPPLGTVVLCGGRREGPRGPSFANPARWFSPTCPEWWKSNVDTTVFPMTVWGSESGWTSVKIDLFCRNIYNTLHSGVLILPYKFPMITSSKRRESFCWDMIVRRVPPFCCEEGLCVSLIRNTK